MLPAAHRLAVGWLACPLALLVACVQPGAFPCQSDADCDSAQRSGACVIPPGFCAHPDDACPSKLRFSTYADAEYAGACVEAAPGTTGTTAAVPSSTSTSTSTSSASGTSSSSTPTSTSLSSSGSSSSSGPSIPAEICDGMDNDLDGLIDEWSPLNEECGPCTLHQENNRAYWACTDNQSWPDNRDMCSALGAHLATIHDSVENLFVSLLVTDSMSFIGLTDIGSEGEYLWAETLEPPDFTAWAEGQPSAGPNDCAAVSDLGEWRILNCLNSREALCAADHPDP